MSRTYTNLLVHIIFSTKQRVPFIVSSFRQDLHGYLGGIIRDLGGVPLEIGGVEDHVHLLVKLKPTIALSDLMRQLKAGSSKWLNETKMKTGKFAWQDGYGAFSVSESQAALVRAYIKNQFEHHRRISFQEELLHLLQKHGIEFDEQYLWD